MSTPLPELEWGDHQDAVSLDLALLQRLAHLALPLLLDDPSAHPLPEAIEIAILSDPAIAAVHAQFMGDPSPTDVITFQHGEILLSADTAHTEAAHRLWPVERELLLYLVHGLLHLQGYDDRDDEARTQMHHRQDAVLHAIWPLP